MKAPGKLVKVNDTQIHIYSAGGQAEENGGTIVFLSGSGTECPTYDFKLLWHLLTDRYRIVVVERPGYGWSGQTDFPRDIDTILEETRAALRQADIKGPFIPAAHSLSGLEVLYWTQKYPHEVMGIIGLDMVVPKLYDSMEVPKFLSLMVLLGHLLRKPIANASVKKHPVVTGGLLTKEEEAEMRCIITKQILSKNMIDEIGFVKENARKVAEGVPPAVPVLCFLSDKMKVQKRAAPWGKVQQQYFAASEQVEFIRLQCGHYVHRENPETICDNIVRFFN